MSLISKHFHCCNVFAVIKRFVSLLQKKDAVFQNLVVLVCVSNKWKEYRCCSFLMAHVDTYLLFVVKITSEQMENRSGRAWYILPPGKRKCSLI